MNIFKLNHTANHNAAYLMQDGETIAMVVPNGSDGRTNIAVLDVFAAMVELMNMSLNLDNRIAQ